MIYLTIIIAVAAAVGAWLWGLIAKGAQLRREARLLHARRVEDYEREELMGEHWSPSDELEDTKTYPDIGIGA
jgi:hypothetical protein